MRPLDVRLAPSVPELGALGVESAEELMGWVEPRGSLARGHAERAGAYETRLVYPLPGTPDESGRFVEPPRGAGTGPVVLRRFHGEPLRRRLASRLTAPRSASRAAREWNLACHLRAHGVVAPDLLALGEQRGGVTSPSSFLVQRVPGDVLPLAEWFAAERSPDERRRGLRALALALTGLLRSRTVLPELSPDDVLLAVPREGCGSSGPPVEGLRVRNLPGVVLRDLRGGSIVRTLELPRKVAMLKALFAPEPLRASFRERELAGVLLRVLGEDVRRPETRAACEEVLAGDAPAPAGR